MYVIDRMDQDLHEDRICLSDSLFSNVRKRYGGYYPAPVSVVSDKGTLYFNLAWESELLAIDDTECENVCIPYCNYYGEDLLEEKEILDYSFVDKYTAIYFDRIDEFSWQIIRLLNQTRPQIILSTDDPLAVFFEDLSIVTGREQERQTESPLIVKIGRIMPDIIEGFSIYSLMISLTWARLRHINPDAEYSETVLRIDPGLTIQGFGDIFKIVSCYVSMAKAHGWVPMICLDHGSQYEDEKGEDCWAKFFDPISDIRPDEIDRYAGWISIFENRRVESVCSKGCCNPYLSSSFSSEMPCSFNFSINRKTESEIEKIAGEIIEACDNALGVVIRTTDFDWLEKSETDVSQMLRKAGDLAHIYALDHVFLATEEETVLSQAKIELGEILCFVPQRRVAEYYGGYLSSVLGDTYDSKYRFGMEYLAAIVALARCDVILYNRMCGAVYVASALRRSLEEKTAMMIDGRLADVFLAVGGAARVFIYGAGYRGRILCMSLMHRAEVLFCDRKAEKGEYLECGCRVISPETMAEEYQGEPVVVTPFGGRQEIVEKLESIGVPQNRICQYSLNESVVMDVEQKHSLPGSQNKKQEKSIYKEFPFLAKNLKPGEHIYIYGAGLIGEMAYEVLAGKLSITFCDKKANNGEYKLYGCKVISPDVLAKEYQGEFVIVTPIIGRADILEMLREKGIPEKRIIEYA